jgi:hypothetical protein
MKIKNGDKKVTNNTKPKPKHKVHKAKAPNSTHKTHTEFQRRGFWDCGFNKATAKLKTEIRLVRKSNA